MSSLMLRENNNSPNMENYIPLPYQGGVRYYREDVFDNMSNEAFNQILNNALPYESGPMMSENGESRRARRRARRDERRGAKAQKKSDRRQARADRQTARQDSKLARVEAKQEGRSERARVRGENIAGLVDAGGRLISGDMSGGNISFGPEGVQAEGNIGVGSDANFITADSLISGVPNYILLGGAGLGIYLLTRKK
ncbi:hypothetical protein CMK13_14220 [Candidatus Poribacteria bacterium]|nr:hypothetical protein [Candidatus Poribacteria bacterium]MAJ74156.1 hypothetical protein [Candidatus Poribacteria bacterium]OUV99026.1 MAG: hypothetical protein CBD16_09030 [Betaproteobacteria bacterium TMED156]OUV99040.1 MAG: hypothetical protein CBD16_09100 [Betaproteobacteria bacterium TMED156]